ncbi:MAG: helix-turn-helix domain-containing protein [Clostridiaceae bacterium]
MDNKYKVLSDTIKNFRKKNNLTQKQLGDIIYKSEISIRKYESGNTNIPFPSLVLLASFFNVAPADFFGTELGLLYSYMEENNISPEEMMLNPHFYNFKQYVQKSEISSVESFEVFVLSVVKEQGFNINIYDKMAVKQIKTLLDILYETTKIVLKNIADDMKKED